MAPESTARGAGRVALTPFRGDASDPRRGRILATVFSATCTDERAGASRATIAVALLLGAFGLVVAWLAWRSRGWPLVHDAPIIHYAAWRIGEGAAPYRDVFDMNFPGVYVLHLAVLRSLGPGDVAWRIFDLGWLAGGALAVAAFARPWGAVAAAGGALFFAAHHLAGGAWHAGQRDFLLTPFLLAAALGVARYLEHRHGLVALVAGGLGLGAGITIKPHAALFAAALTLVLAARGDRARAVTVFAAAVAVPVVAVVAWVAALGGLGAWRAIVLDYLVPLYSRLGRPEHWGFHRWHVWIAIAVAVAASLASAAAHRRFTVRHALATLGLGYGLGHYVGQGKGWEYHVYPLAAFAAVLLFSEIDGVLRSRARLLAVVVTVSIALVVAMLAAKGAEAAAAAEDGWIAVKERRVTALVEQLAGRLGGGDLVQVLDTSDGGVHALLRLRAVQPTRFLYDFHFFHDADSPVIRALRAELMRGLEARPPRFIVLFRRGWPSGDERRVATFPALSARLAAAYRVERSGDGYVIYAKRDGS